MLRFLIDKIKWELLNGLNAKEAVDKVAGEQGLSTDGKTYKYLLQRAEELKVSDYADRQKGREK